MVKPSKVETPSGVNSGVFKLFRFKNGRAVSVLCNFFSLACVFVFVFNGRCNVVNTLSIPKRQ